MKNRSRARIRAAVIGFLFAACSPGGASQPFQVLDRDATALRDRFNADVGKVRVLMLVSPSCGVCLRGAADVQDRLLATENSKELLSYVVWVPKLGGEEKHVGEATRLVPDRRALHYWDGAGATIRGYTDTLELPEDAWDIYMVYGPDARWEGTRPPKPSYWMHQLGSPDQPRVNGPYLDASVLASQAKKLLMASSKPRPERGEQSSRVLTLTRDRLTGVREAFNAGSDGPRLIVFFSSGCRSCDTGSTALQAMLERVQGPLTVLAVWEPIEATDPPPAANYLDNLTDARVQQLWDPEHLMSDALRAAELAHPASIAQARLRMNKEPDGILYDTAVLFRPGARWESTLPAPDYLDGGLAAVLEELRRRLEAFAVTGTSQRPAL